VSILDCTISGETVDEELGMCHNVDYPYNVIIMFIQGTYDVP